jgi:sulfide:quinone oxidoreductase
MKVLVLGAGFGGLELTTRLSEELGEDAEILLIDKAEGFVFGFSKLDVMFGRKLPSAVFHPYSDLVKPGVRFLQATVRSIDPDRRRVETDAGSFEGDVVVVALGADLDPGATPGLLESGNEFYTVPGAFGLRDVLATFAGGDVVIGVTSSPFKCPPAPSETALLTHDYLSRKGCRDSSSISLVMPLGVPIPPSPGASAALLAAFDERGIIWRPERMVTAIDGDRKVAVLNSGEELPFDLFLGVPVHKAPAVVVESGLTVDGWIPVEPLTLKTTFPDVYAIGDVTSVGTPKAGVFAEGQASIVAEQIIAASRGKTASRTYDGRGVCYLEFGGGLVATVDVTFLSGAAPVGEIDGPSIALSASKAEFGTSRIRRWFNRDWPTEAAPD